MTKRSILVTWGLVIALTPSIASAQSRMPRIAIGVTAGFVMPSEEDASAQVGVGPLFRFGEDEGGWGPAIGLGWFSSELDGTVGAATGPYARITVRPVMAGIAYTWINGRWSYEAGVTAGYTFNSVELLDAGQRIFPGASNVTAEISNSIALRPRLRAWYDVNDRIGLMIGTGLTFTRPGLTFRSGGTTLTRDLGGAAWQIDSGIAVRVF